MRIVLPLLAVVFICFASCSQTESAEPRATTTNRQDAAEEDSSRVVGDDSPEPSPGSRDRRAKTIAADAEPNGKDSSALAVFRKRILPLFHAKTPSSCTECHLGGVDLKDYLHPDQEKTFASLVKSGLVDVKKPMDSKILRFIRRSPKVPSPLTQRVREKE
ncbi:MAG: hypothetical protein N2C14_02925, partial [Planctomycetales bacterium]